MKLQFVYDHPEQGLAVDVIKGDARQRLFVSQEALLGKGVPHVAELLVAQLDKLVQQLDPEPAPVADAPEVEPAPAEATQ